LKKLEQNRLRNACTGRRVIAALLLLQFLFLVAVAGSESLHKAIHPDADKATHHCAITMLQSGQVDTPICALVIVPTVNTLTPLVVFETFFIPSVDYSLPPSCGPPALLS